MARAWLEASPAIGSIPRVQFPAVCESSVCANLAPLHCRTAEAGPSTLGTAPVYPRLAFPGSCPCGRTTRGSMLNTTLRNSPFLASESSLLAQANVGHLPRAVGDLSGSRRGVLSRPSQQSWRGLWLTLCAGRMPLPPVPQQSALANNNGVSRAQRSQVVMRPGVRKQLARLSLRCRSSWRP